MTSLKRIPITKLEVGMYVSEESRGLCSGGMNAKGFIMREETIERLKQRNIEELVIDTAKGKDSPFARLLNGAKTQPLKPVTNFDEERKQAEKVYQEAMGLVGTMLTDVKLGKALDIAPMQRLADDINNSILNNHNALLCLSQIREKDQYLLQHSINVGILMGIFARYLSYQGADLHAIVTGALLHDIGKIRVPNQILNKPGKFKSDEWEEMKKHVIYGQEVLEKSDGIGEVEKVICSFHHEKMDGGGYPRGVKGQDIPEFGRIASVVDVYDALTATRCYKEGKTPLSALSMMRDMAKEQHLDLSIVEQFIDCMGLYPIGTCVELSNGKLGVVIENKTDHPEGPVVNTFYNLRHRHYEKKARQDLSRALNDLAIVGTRDPLELDIDINDFM